jgi:hypothetical protein
MALISVLRKEQQVNNKKGSFGSLFLFILILYSFPAWSDINSTSKDVLEVLSQNKNLEVVEATIKLEDAVDKNSQTCILEDEKDPCNKYPSPFLSKEKKSSGWKVLFEAKYQKMPAEKVLNNFSWTGNDDMFRQNVELYYENNPSNPDIYQERENIQNWVNTNINGEQRIPHDQILGQILIKQLESGTSYNDIMSRVKTYSDQMSDDDYRGFLVTLAGWVKYNTARASLKGPEAKGKINAYDMLVGKTGGICGDIHTMVSKMAEVRGWESFTVGYALAGGQHVVTAIVDPKNKDKIGIINYGTYEETSLVDGNSVAVTGASYMQDVGMQLRIMKNDKGGGKDGAMKLIANIPTALGSFMYDLFQNQNAIQNAMPQNENYNMNTLSYKKNDVTVSDGKNGGIIEKDIGKGIIIYQGTADGAEIYGIAVNEERFNKIMKIDPVTGKCIERQTNYFTVGLAGSLIEKQYLFDKQKMFYAYLNVKGGKIFHIYQTEFVVFKGFVGYDVQAMFSQSMDGKNVFDGNLMTLAGVSFKYQKEGKLLETKVTMEAVGALKDQQLTADLKKLPSNINLFNFNALSIDVKGQLPLSKNMTLITDNNIALTKVGSRVYLSTGILMNNTSIVASYQGSMKSIPLANSLKNVNLLSNFNNMDGFKLSLSQTFKQGSVSGWGGMSTGTGKSMPMGGATLKLNLFQSKK